MTMLPNQQNFESLGEEVDLDVLENFEDTQLLDSAFDLGEQAVGTAVDAAYQDIETETELRHRMTDLDLRAAQLPKKGAKAERKALETEETELFTAMEMTPALAKHFLKRFPKAHSLTHSPNDSLHQIMGQYRGWRTLRRGEEVGLAKILESSKDTQAKIAENPELPFRERRDARKAIAQGDDAKFVFTMSNIGLVYNSAHKAFKRPLRPPSVELADLIQEGNAGLTRAIDKFDWQRGIRFYTMAENWIKRDIDMFLSTDAHLIRLSRERATIFHDALKCAEEGHDELSSEDARLLTLHSPFYLEHKTHSDNDQTVGDNIPATDRVDDEVVETDEAKREIRQMQAALESMDEVQREVILRNYGLAGYEPQGRKPIAEELNIGTRKVETLLRTGKILIAKSILPLDNRGDS